MAWECYVQELRFGGADIYTVDVEVPSCTLDVKVPPTPPVFLDEGVETWDKEILQQAEPNELLELIALHLEWPKTMTRIGTRH